MDYPKFRQTDGLGPDIESNETRRCGHELKLQSFPNPKPNFNTQIFSNQVGPRREAGLFLGADEDEPLHPVFFVHKKYAFNRGSQGA
jgi:hypothetical protein